jgi:uncharacterized protein (TIGR02145 family)
MGSVVRRQTKALSVLTGWMLLFSGCTKDPNAPVTGTFTDSRDQKGYKWVTIGTQTWMAENLAWLPAVSPPLAGSDTIPFYYVFRFMGSDVPVAKAWDYYSDLGVFYNWPAAMNGADTSDAVPSGIQGACPDGWHIPSDREWDILVNFLGGEYTAGKTMKSKKGWNNYAGEPGEGDNSSGFNGLAAGGRNNGGGFYNLGFNALFWSSTGFGQYSAWRRLLEYSHNGVYRYYFNKSFGLSVRCVKND